MNASADAERRVQEYTQGADFSWVTGSLVEQREQILNAWIDAATRQSFHKGRRESAVTDHIPILFDALTDLLRVTTPRWVDPYAPMDNAAVLAASQAHARTRAEQGLQPADVVVEFRLLRQEIWRALRSRMPGDAPSSDVVAAEMFINDALDGAIGQALSSLTDRIEQLREDFLTTTMHEIRQPLTLIIGEAQLSTRFLSKGVPDVEGALAANTRLQRAIARMNSLLKTLFIASQLGTGNINRYPREADLKIIALNAAAELGHETAGRIVVTTSPGLDTQGWWDPDQLQQVFANLLSNAAKYSPPGSPIEVELSGGDQLIEASVRDRGIGIPAGDLPNLFGRYMRGENAIEQGIEGLGLGLYLCRGIVEAHGGTISASSPGPGGGTTITVTLPRRSEISPE